MHQRVTRRPLYRRLPSLLGHTPRWQAGVAARLPSCWHLCTGGWSLRGDVRGTCPRSPCTVPAMCADVSPSAASPLTAVAVPAPGRSLVCWPVPPSAGHPGGRVVLRRRVGIRVEGCGRTCRGAAPFWWGGSSADPRCWSSVLRGSSPGGVLPVDSREGVDRAGPVGLKQVARAGAGFEGAPYQGQQWAVLASHRWLGPGFHRKLHSWYRSETGAGQRKKPPLGGGSSKDCDGAVAAYEDASGAG